MQLIEEIKEVMKSNADHGGTPPDTAAAITLMFVKREVAKAQDASRSSVVLGVATQMLAARQGFDGCVNPDDINCAVKDAEALIARVNEGTTSG